MNSDEIHQYMCNSGYPFIETEYSSQTFLVKITLDGMVFPLVYSFRAKKVIVGVSSYEDFRKDIIIHRNSLIPSSLNEISAIDPDLDIRREPDAFFTY